MGLPPFVKHADETAPAPSWDEIPDDLKLILISIAEAIRAGRKIRTATLGFLGVIGMISALSYYVLGNIDLWRKLH